VRLLSLLSSAEQTLTSGDEVGIRTTYLNDLWVWSLTDYRWQQIEFGLTERKPPCVPVLFFPYRASSFFPSQPHAHPRPLRSPRSGFSFLPSPDGLVVYGGYSKTYEGKRVTGQALNDCWLLKIPPIGDDNQLDTKKFKWEKRKNPGYPPNPVRSGCTMAYWANKGMGVLFGGVSDDDKDEETLESTFWNEMCVSFLCLSSLPSFD
jgi:hypothetical protein